MRKSRWVERRIRPRTWLDLSIIVGLLVGSAWLRHDALGPPALWLDDAWAALVIKSEGISGIQLTGGTAPGFAALLKGWLQLTGFSTLKAQLLPFLLGVAAPPTTYIALSRAGTGRLGALGAALMLAVSPSHVVYSTRVKQYTLDAVGAIAVLSVALWLLKDLTSPKRWAILFSVALAAMVLSSPAIVVVASSFAAAFLASLTRGSRPLRLALLSGVPAGVLATAWAYFVLSPSVNDALRSYWAGYYLSLDRGLSTDLLGALKRTIEGFSPLPFALSVGVLVIAISIVAVSRPYAAVLFASPIVIAVGLAMAELSPLGTGRTEIYLYPALAMAVGIALHNVVSLDLPSGLALTLVLGLAMIHAGIGLAPVKYPRQDMAPLVSELETRHQPNEVVLIYPHASFALCLYTSWPVRFEATWRYAAGFQCQVDKPNVHVLQGFRGEPETNRSEIQAVSGVDVIWFIVSHGAQDVRAIEGMLRDYGYEQEERFERPGAHLTRWIYSNDNSKADPLISSEGDQPSHRRLVGLDGSGNRKAKGYRAPWPQW